MHDVKLKTMVSIQPYLRNEWRISVRRLAAVRALTISASPADFSGPLAQHKSNAPAAFPIVSSKS